MTNFISISVSVNANAEKAWNYWTKPEHIVNWNHASDEWHTPRATVDLKVGGHFMSRMEAKDGSFGFDFTGEFVTIDNLNLIEYEIIGGRKVKIEFKTIENQTTISQTFQAEDENSLELQRQGWQAIMNNFKKYIEA